MSYTRTYTHLVTLRYLPFVFMFTVNVTLSTHKSLCLTADVFLSGRERERQRDSERV